MARVNITIPDDVLARARDADLNVSRLATSAIERELERLLKIKLLDEYLAELEAEQGPPTPEEQAAAKEWVDGILAVKEERKKVAVPGRSRRKRSA